MSVWTDLVGQNAAVPVFEAAVDGAMTHAWLICGPPGSGRSVAALAFAAALQCENDGCGGCASCRDVRNRTHADITIVDTQGLSIGVKEAREVVRRAAMHPSVGAWQVIIVEDADRLTEQAANALLKAIEEPAPATVWLLCAPSADDVIVTIRSRCRLVTLRTPSTEVIAELLMHRDGIEPREAAAIAAASQGHIGRARALARDPETRDRRRRITLIPTEMRDVADAIAAARQVVTEADERTSEVFDDLDAREKQDLATSWGVVERGKRPVGYAGALSALEKEQKARRSRSRIDAIDGVLLDLLSVLRDVIALQMETGADLINAEISDELVDLGSRTTTDHTLAALDAVTDCRDALRANAMPQLALERMMVRLVP